MKPAIRTRRTADTSIFGDSGVSIGTSKEFVHPPCAARRTRLGIVAALRAVIDFFEEIVVLTDQDVLGVERNRLLVRLARVLEAAFVLVADAQVVPRGGVRRIEFNRLFPAIRRLFPEAILRDLDAELDL
jgi:hypothetical protein